MDVPHSLSELRDEVDSLLRNKPASLDLAGAGPDVVTGGVQISLERGRSNPNFDEQVKTLIIPGVRRILSPGMSVRVNIRDAATKDTRADDFAPWTGGAEMLSYGAGATHFCSLEMPIKIGTSNYALTAGHCYGTSYYNHDVATNSDTFLGSQYTTSYPGNAYRFGDWSLIRQSTYSMSIFTGALSSSTRMSLAGGNFGSRALGSQLCSSGRTTAQTCRYFVEANYQTESIDGVWTGPMIKTYHDSDLNGSSDSEGFNGGDFGGPAYYASSGSLIAMGIVTGRTWKYTGPATWDHKYWFTHLTGVRNWSPSAIVAN